MAYSKYIPIGQAKGNMIQGTPFTQHKKACDVWHLLIQLNVIIETGPMGVKVESTVALMIERYTGLRRYTLPRSKRMYTCIQSHTLGAGYSVLDRYLYCTFIHACSRVGLHSTFHATTVVLCGCELTSQLVGRKNDHRKKTLNDLVNAQLWLIVSNNRACDSLLFLILPNLPTLSHALFSQSGLLDHH